MVYVLSDIHGNERRFDSILRQITLQEDDTLYILGDVIDRYPDGLRILQRIMKMQNAKMLLGNHEYMMLRALGHPYDTTGAMTDRDLHIAKMLWYQNGGKVTQQYWNRLRKDLRKEIIDYLHGLPLNIDIEVTGKQYKLVHGAPKEDYNISSHYENAAQFSVWERLAQGDLNGRNYTLVFGHTPTEHYQGRFPMSIWKHANGIGIDCGSGYPEAYDDHRGRLACLRLDDGFTFYSDESA